MLLQLASSIHFCNFHLCYATKNEFNAACITLIFKTINSVVLGAGHAQLMISGKRMRPLLYFMTHSEDYEICSRGTFSNTRYIYLRYVLRGMQKKQKCYNTLFVIIVYSLFYDGCRP